MRMILARLSNVRLHYILILAFVLTATVTIGIGSLMTNRVIKNYLAEAQDARVGRDMDLAEAFYNIKLHDISSTTSRLASGNTVKHRLLPAAEGDAAALEAIDEEIGNEIFNLPVGTQRFIVVTDAQGVAIAGQVASSRQFGSAVHATDWSNLPIMNAALSAGDSQSATEVIPAEILAWVGLEDQAQIRSSKHPRPQPNRMIPGRARPAWL
jgi:hypothetical protein